MTDDPNDLLCDDMGVWRSNGVDNIRYLISLSNGQISTIKKRFSSDACVLCTWHQCWFKEADSIYLWYVKLYSVWGNIMLVMVIQYHLYYTKPL